MNRTAAATFIYTEYDSLFIKAKLTNLDDVTGMQPIIDNAFRLLHFTEDLLATAVAPDDSDGRDTFLQALRYFGLERILAKLFYLSSQSIGAEKSDYQQIFKNVQTMRDYQKEILDQLTKEMVFTRINTDYLEPSIWELS